MAEKVPQDAFIVVADGTGARFFRNTGKGFDVTLKPDGELHPSRLDSDGPAGKRPPDSSRQETDEATFVKQLANDLYRRAHQGDLTALVLVADRQTLGQLRPLLHKEVQRRVVGEHGKALTKASVADIQRTLNAE
jgi:protein required for attachment to host cells